MVKLIPNFTGVNAIPFLIYLFFLLLLLSNLNGQKIVTGRIIDSSNKEPLPDINIIVIDENIGSASDDNGFFRIEIPSKISSFSLEASAIGFASVKKDFQIEKINDFIIFELESEIIELDPVMVIHNLSRLDLSLIHI